MRIRILGFCLVAGIASAGCSGGGGSSGTSPEAGPVATGAGAHDAGEGNGPPTPDGGVTPVAEGGTPVSSSSLQAITMRSGGRHATDLVFDVQGSDPTGHTTELHARLLDASNNPVAAFDTNWDGVGDSAEQRLHFDASTLGQKTFTQTVTLPNLYSNFPTIASAIVSLSDINGGLSPSLTAPLTPQGAAELGSPCDVNEIANLCTEGLSCGGTPSTCLACVAPELSQVSYFGNAAEATEVFVGADPDEDLQTVIVQFLDGSGNSVKVDLSGDGVGTPVSSEVIDARGVLGKAFFFQNNPASVFTTLVPKLSVTPVDALGRKGPAVPVSVQAQVVRTPGQSCDAYGINACSTGAVCSPRLVGAVNTCSTVVSLQSNKCSTAPPAATVGLLAAWGQTVGVSLWDPPPNCSLPTVVGRPESVVMLTLAKAVNTLTVSTATPETDFDTVLYVLPGCATDTTKALGCADDSPNQGFASTVTLTAVAAGSYAIVIDSGSPQGGHFGLSVTMQ